MKKSELQEMSKTELKELAREHEIEGRSTMSEEELVEALSKVRTGSGSGKKGETIMTTPREPEEQNAVGHSTRGEDTELAFEQAPGDLQGAGDHGAADGGTGGTTVAVTDSSGPAR